MQLFQIELGFTRGGTGIKYNLQWQGKCFKPAVFKNTDCNGMHDDSGAFYFILPTLAFPNWACGFNGRCTF